MGEITLLLERARSGDGDAWERVVALLHHELLHLARRVRSGNAAPTLNATALVNECYLRMARRGAAAIDSREHFFAVAARAMRQILVNYARDRLAAKRGSGALHVPFDDQHPAADHEAGELLALDAAMARLAVEDERMVRVLDCRVFGGLTEGETAAALELPLRTVQRLWQRARERLRSLLPD